MGSAVEKQKSPFWQADPSPAQASTCVCHDGGGAVTAGVATTGEQPVSLIWSWPITKVLNVFGGSGPTVAHEPSQLGGGSNGKIFWFGMQDTSL